MKGTLSLMAGPPRGPVTSETFSKLLWPVRPVKPYSRQTRQARKAVAPVRPVMPVVRALALRASSFLTRISPENRCFKGLAKPVISLHEKACFSMVSVKCLFFNGFGVSRGPPIWGLFLASCWPLDVCLAVRNKSPLDRGVGG